MLVLTIGWCNWTRCEGRLCAMVGGRAGEGDQREEAEGERRKGGDGAFCTFTLTGELFGLPWAYNEHTVGLPVGYWFDPQGDHTLAYTG
jgi:hypothetical protein